MSDLAGNVTVIAADAILRGELSFQGQARILGQIEGKITSPGQLHIGEQSVCKASIDATVVVVDGTVEGDVVARERLELAASAIIRGDITTAKLVVSEGATFTGHCTVCPEAANAKSRGDTLPAAAPVATLKPTVRPITRPRVTPQIAEGNGELESALAGLESKLAGFARKSPSLD
ncbi:MAG: bactofilin family protein [Phycisphaerales bacterium]